MPYIGNPIYQSAFVTDQFSGDGTTTAFTMSVAPAGVSNVLVAVSGVLQDPSTYGVVGNTLTFTAAPPSGTGNISCRYLGVPVTGVVTTAYRTVTEFTATASQTTFTPPSYTVGYINVYLNGVLLASTDYTATNGTTVVLATGASAGNILTTESFRVESVANAISNSAGSVGTSNLADGSVTTAKIASSVTLTTPTLTSPIITGSTPQVTVYTSSSGTYTTPTNCRYLIVELSGGGASGGGGGNGSAGWGSGGGGGGAGGYCRKLITSPSATYSYSIGSGGSGVGVNSNGNNGGTTSFGSLSAGGGNYGGAGGSVGNLGTVGAGGTCSGGDLNIQGGSGFIGSYGVVGSTQGVGGMGGGNQLSGQTGSSGVSYGGGGVGGGGGGSSSAGAGGVVVVTAFF